MGVEVFRLAILKAQQSLQSNGSFPLQSLDVSVDLVLCSEASECISTVNALIHSFALGLKDLSLALRTRYGASIYPAIIPGPQC